MIMHLDNIAEHQAGYMADPSMSKENSTFKPALDSCTIKEVSIIPKEFGGSSETPMKIFIIRPNTIKDDRKAPGLVYYHGGGFVFGDAEINCPIASQSAVDNGCVYFVVDYGMAPKVKVPENQLNSYAGLKWALKNA
jgi:acetyl esterase